MGVRAVVGEGRSRYNTSGSLFVGIGVDGVAEGFR